MNKPKSRFILWNAITTFVLCLAGYIVFSFFYRDYFNFLYPVLVLSAFVINILSYRISEKSEKKDLTTLLKSFSLRFFFYLAIAIIYLIIEEALTKRLVFILTMFSVYIIYSVLETSAVVNLMRGKRSI